jgi:hypothetical protein
MAVIGSYLRLLVWTRSRGVSEYCRMPDEFDPLSFSVEHNRPQFHPGRCDIGGMLCGSACHMDNHRRIS